MIFISVGTQAPFDRLIKVVDEWAKSSKKECFAQTGKGAYIPKYIKTKSFLSEQEFTNVFNKSSIIISHAGMGSIISSLNNRKILLTIPRLSQYKEHRNNHQVATTKALVKKGYIYPIYNEEDLLGYLNRIEDLKSLKSIDEANTKELISFLKNI